MLTKKEKGQRGEELAENFYKKRGYRLLAKNFYSYFGEVDRVFLFGDTIVFVEVRGRKNSDFGLPEETVTLSKQKKIIKTALYFLHKKHITDLNVRFDIYSIIWGSGEKIVRSYAIEDAFNTDGCSDSL